MNKEITCPTCRKKGTKAIYAGIPIKICLDEECSTVWGFWSFLMNWLPFNGWFFFYEGSYLSALWQFLFLKEGE